jgi:quinoprotein glucose dehydrogenase
MRSFLAGVLLSLLCAPAFPQEDAEHEAAKKRLRPAEGLQVSLWAANPQVANPVAISIDEKGRIYVAECFRRHTSTLDIHMRKEWLDDDLACRRHEDQVAYHERRLGERAKEWKVESERIRLLEDRSGAGRADRATVFSDGYRNLCEGIGAGILVRNGEVWYSCIPNLWYLKDTDGDGQADVRKALHHGFGVHLGASGHDFHGLRFGPDGKLYMSHGDRGFHVEADGKVVSFPDGGGVLRCNPDGSELEVVCVGLRNPQELQFDHYGNLFTGDNNISKAPDVGETCRWTYVVEGADYGWRIGYQFMQTGGAWCAEEQWKLEAGFQVPHVARLGHGPSGVTVHPGVAAIPERFKNHFFMCDYPGGIWAFEMKPKGASFEMVNLEKFLWELQSPDVEFGPDGAVYVADWVGMWDKVDKGRIWKLADPERLKDPAVLEVKKLIGEGMSERPVDELAGLCGHADQRIRQAAQFELVARKELSALTKLADAAHPQLARIHAIWALGQLKAKEPLLPLLGDADPEVRAQAAKTLGGLRTVLAYDRFVALLKDESPRVRFFAAMGLGKIGKRDAIAPVLEFLRANNNDDRMLQHAGIMALTWIEDVESIVKAGKDGSPALRMAALVSLRKLKRPELASFLQDADPKLVLEAARAIYDEPIREAFPELVRLLPSRGAPERALLRAAAAAFALGDARALASVVPDSGYPSTLRVEVLRMLAQWESGANRDWLMGLWRPVPGRDPSEARKELDGVLEAALLNLDVATSLETVRTAKALGLASLADRLSAIADGTQALPGRGKIRAEALRTLAALKDPRAGTIAKKLLSDPDGSLRLESVSVIGDLQVADALPSLRALALEAGPWPIRQAALKSLARLGADVELSELFSRGVPAPLRLDLLEAAATRPSLKEKRATLEGSFPPYYETLEGGDAEAGRRIFFERSDVQCVRCHQIGEQGGQVGPPLTKIAEQKTREYLLESIVTPNKQIAEGWGQTAFQLQNDAVELGRVEKETDAAVTLLLADGQRKTIAKGDIKARKAALSAMPEDIVKQLSRRDLRDLIEFLAGLK